MFINNFIRFKAGIDSLKGKYISFVSYLLKTIDQFLRNRTLQDLVRGELSETFTSLHFTLLYNLYCHDMYNHNNEREHQINEQAYILQFAADTTLIAHDNTNKSMKKLQELTDVTAKPK